MTESPPPARPGPAGFLERTIEAILFGSRWVLAPFYLGLAISLLTLLTTFLKKMIGLVGKAWSVGTDENIVSVLSLIDLSLMANLVLIVMWAGYENFVSRLDLENHRDRPDWISHITYGDLKIKLLTSIVAISAIHVLEDFMHPSALSDRELGWSVGIHLTFVLSGVLLAVMDRMAAGKNQG